MARGGARPGAGRKKGGTNKTTDRRRRIKEAAIERAVAKLAITKEAVLGELAKLSFSNMLDYMKIGPDGDPRLDFSRLTRDQAAAIHELVVETRTEARDDGPPAVIVKTKFKLADKRAPLTELGKHLGLFRERVEHTGPDGGPIETGEVYSDIEAARLIGRLLNKVAAASPPKAGGGPLEQELHAGAL
jgi:phage terminase small subunit